MLGNIISAFFSRSFVALCNFGILLLSSHYLGSDLLGQASLLVLNMAIIQTINEVYTGSSLVYFIPSHSISQIYRQGFLFALTSTLLFNLINYWLGGKGHELWPHLLCLSFMITINAFNNVILLAKERVKLYNLMVFLQPFIMISAFAIQIFLLNDRSLNAYIHSLYISYGVSLLISSIRVMGFINENEVKAKISILNVIKNGFMNQLGNLAHTLSNRFNYYVLGSAALVGVYASSTSLVEGIWIISGSVSPLILSYVANQTDGTKNAILTLLLAKLCLLLGVICVLVLFLIPGDFFVTMLGPGFGQTKTVMLYLSPGILCLSFSSIISHYFSGLGLQKIQLLANTLGLLVTLCLAWPLIRAFGLLGACYAASAAYFVQAFVLTLVFIRKNKISAAEIISLNLNTHLLK